MQIAYPNYNKLPIFHEIREFLHFFCIIWHMASKLSKARQRLGFVLRNTGPTFTVAEVADVLDLKRIETSKILSRWTAQGWVVRLRRNSGKPPIVLRNGAMGNFFPSQTDPPGN